MKILSTRKLLLGLKKKSDMFLVFKDFKVRVELDMKSKKCIFLGYADRMKGYRLWDPTDHKAIAGMDEIFAKDQLQRKDGNDNMAKASSETTMVQVENNPVQEALDSSESTPDHEIQWYCESLVVKEYAQKECIDFNKIFSLVV